MNGSICLLLALFFTSVLAGLVDRMQDVSDAQRYPLIRDFIRIEANILRLDNPRGISHTGLPCDITDSCDPRVIAFIDTEKPNHDFGGDSVPYRNWFTLYDGNNINSPEINKLITRDICGVPIRKVNVRVRAIDKDMFNDDKIDNFACFITTDNTPAADEKSAQWSAEMPCYGEDKSAIRVWIQWRWYLIPEQQCRASSNGRGWLDGWFTK
ncbi:hypothetical protein RvY_00337 [Ramazzottius varieornatus]|uniref:Uncharacterized protein n=1 Tax=Ramazzottius varieornatus TaxID=947166 RepID=A0A1D1UGJ2_RAMVA|nr:hypothetical protein RvY_00337 [Ramazzottius varieornatus]